MQHVLQAQGSAGAQAASTWLRPSCARQLATQSSGPQSGKPAVLQRSVVVPSGGSPTRIDRMAAVSSSFRTLPSLSQIFALLVACESTRDYHFEAQDAPRDSATWRG